MPDSDDLARVRPLLARPGARYACVGDGLCCTDLHGVGPLRPIEARMFRAMHPDLIVRFSGHQLLRSGEGGRCPFLEDAGCALHERLGAGAKPRVCIRFPFGLTATPLGGRVTTSLRCSCRTLGDRPPLSLQAAEHALSFPSGRLLADQRVSGSIEVREGEAVPFARYAALESDLLREIEACERPLEVFRKRIGARRSIGVRARSTLRERGEALATATLDTRFGAAVAWLGHAMRVQAGAQPESWPVRPWRDDFDRAEARTPAPVGARAGRQVAQTILADFAAEALWNLDWVGRRPLAEQLRFVSSQLEQLEILLEALQTEGARPDRAAAEAVMILDLAQLEDGERA